MLTAVLAAFAHHRVERREREESSLHWRASAAWWEEVKRCVEGDHVPSKTEGWNHPVASACDFTSWVSDVCHQDAERLIMVISFLPCG